MIICRNLEEVLVKMSGKKKAALFESDSDSEEDEPKAGTSKSGGFTINESYANIYDGFRRKEQLQKLKADILFPKHACSILRQSFNPVCCSWKS